MTAFGRGAKETPFGRLILELSSLNRKHLEVRCQLPAQLQSFEPLLRQQIAKTVPRGAISLMVRLQGEREMPSRLRLNNALLEQLDKAAADMAQTIGQPQERCLEMLVGGVQHQLLTEELDTEELETLWPTLVEALSAALTALGQMKEAEGRALTEDLALRVKAMRGWLGEIEALAPAAMEKVRQRLKAAAAALLTDEARVNELQLCADRYDVTEEIVRLGHHLRQLQESFSTSKTVSGREVEFRLQELLREANTLGAKASNTAIIERVLAIKGEIERIRQQVQNVE